MTVLGFTGTRAGLSLAQQQAFQRVLQRSRPTEFHHGDCLGADHQAHCTILKYLIPNIVIHPPDVDTYRANCDKIPHNGTNVLVFPPLPYLERNHVIVDSSDGMIATPYEMLERMRSGTWATVRYTRKMNKPLCMIYPNGTTTFERWEALP